MADVQKHFEEFHDQIRLTGENETLREKRDIILNKLKDKLKKLSEEDEAIVPTFSSLNRGSYAMGTGVVPIDQDYDIDVGLIFNICKDDYPDPVIVKQWVYDALEGHTDEVVIQQPCVTVHYHLGEEPAYHVDLAVYAHDGNLDSLYLARGKPHSIPERRIWDPVDPKGLIALIRDHFDDTGQRKQFRRVVRYLKRWKDVKFSSEGNAAPIGIGITVAAYYWFTPKRTLVDRFANTYRDNDLLALQSFVNVMLQNFTLVACDGEAVERLCVTLPVRPHNDLFEKMTNRQMSDFKEKLESLKQTLDEAQSEVDPVEACEKLQLQLDEFPVPDPSETAQKRARAIVSSSSSA